MKAALDFPDGFCRRVKARSVMEGRPARSVAVDLFQKWLEEKPLPDGAPVVHADDEKEALVGDCPFVREDQNHDMDAIKAVIGKIGEWRSRKKQTIQAVQGAASFMPHEGLV